MAHHLLLLGLLLPASQGFSVLPGIRSQQCTARTLSMCDPKDAELNKEVPFAGYEPSKMKFKDATYRNQPMGGKAGSTIGAGSQVIKV